MNERMIFQNDGMLLFLLKLTRILLMVRTRKIKNYLDGIVKPGDVMSELAANGND
jgi:hypothetical protein